jgi:hypothetical protein
MPFARVFKFPPIAYRQAVGMGKNTVTRDRPASDVLN